MDPDPALVVERTATAPGLLLRPWVEQDIPAMVAAHRDPVMRRWLRHPVTSADEARRIIQARCADREAGAGFGLPRQRPLERLELIHSVGNHASCRVAEKAGFAFSAVLPPLLPDFPDDGHLHIRRGS